MKKQDCSFCLLLFEQKSQMWRPVLCWDSIARCHVTSWDSPWAWWSWGLDAGLRCVMLINGFRQDAQCLGLGAVTADQTWCWSWPWASVAGGGALQLVPSWEGEKDFLFPGIPKQVCLELLVSVCVRTSTCLGSCGASAGWHGWWRRWAEHSHGC